MDILLFFGFLIPFFGTSLGALTVIFAKKSISERTQIYLNEFAAGVMVAASVWSLLLPAIEQSKELGKLSFVPADAGFFLGIFFMIYLQKKFPYEAPELDSRSWSGGKSCKSRLRLFIFAIVIHNIPEGMAVGASFSEYLFGGGKSMFMPAFMLSVGIAIQNIPEGAIISLPLCAEGMRKGKACFCGILSGAVEPVAAVITVFLSRVVLPVLPYLLGFSAGAMIFVVVEELLPGAEERAKLQKRNLQGGCDFGEKIWMGTLLFAVGFSLMMILDVALG